MNSVASGRQRLAQRPESRSGLSVATSNLWVVVDWDFCETTTFVGTDADLHYANQKY